MRTWIAAMMLLCSGLAFASGQTPKTSGKPFGEQAEHSAPVNQKPQDDKRDTDEITLVVKNYPQETAQSAADAQEDRREKAYTDAWTVRIGKMSIAIGALTILILIVQAIVFWLQAKRLKETVGEMRTHASHELRAYLAIEDVAYVREGGMGTGQMRYTIRNVGKTPANNVVTHAKPFVDTFPMANALSRLDFSIDPSPRIVIHPGSGNGGYEHIRFDMDMDIADRRRLDPKIVYFQIEVRYTDIYCTGDEFRFTSVLYHFSNVDGIDANKLVAYSSGHDYS